MSDSIRVLIAEDSGILRHGLSELLERRGFEITAAVSDPVALCEAVEADPPDVAIVDIRMPPTFTDEGLWAAIDVRRRHPSLGILMFSQYVETHYASQLLAHDAAGIGYLLKDRVADVSDFVEAVVRVASGGTALDPEVVTQLVGAFSPQRVDRRAQRPRARSAVAHGGGAIQRRHRDCPRRLGGRGAKAHRQHLRQALVATFPGGSPPGLGGAPVARVVAAVG
jgi:DNA-binding NarL/FixJ family response regulator